MAVPTTLRLAESPPAPVVAALRARLSPRDFQAMRLLMALRGTAQTVDNTLTSWFADTAGNVARYQILTLLWASSAAVSHKDIVSALGVTRATISGLMAGLDRDGLVQSVADPNDRRSQLASLTAEGRVVAEKAVADNEKRFRAALTSLTLEEMSATMSLLQRVRQSFAAAASFGETHD
jgi:DNA-binding MarR family transcriptional regulator